MESEKRRSHKKLCSSSISQVILDTHQFYKILYSNGHMINQSVRLSTNQFYKILYFVLGGAIGIFGLSTNQFYKILY